jgi:hypothetical protein
VRVRELIIATVCGSFGIAGSGCSMVLGIEDPTADFGDDGGDDDVPPPGAERVTLNLTQVQIKQLQRVSLRVTAVYPDGSMPDVTTSAMYESDNRAVAAVGSPGQLEGGMQAGMATITVRLGEAQPATVAVTVLPKTCVPVINELQTAGTSSADEWVEIVNPCTRPADVTNWTLVYRAATTTGTTDSASMMPLSGQLMPGDIRLFAGQDYAGANDGKWPTGGSSGIMAQASGAIALRMGAKDMGEIADAVAYGTVTAGHPFIETSALPAMASSRPAQRQPFDGRDSGDGMADFVVVQTGSPRAPNAP